MKNKISLLLLSLLVISCGNSDEQISSVVEEETSVVEEETSVVEEETSVVEEETSVVEEETSVVEEETSVVEEETTTTTTTTTTTIPVYQKVKSLMFLLSKLMTKTVLLKYLVTSSNVK